MEDAISTLMSVLVWVIIIVVAVRRMKSKSSSLPGAQDGSSSAYGGQKSPSSISGAQRDMSSAARATREPSAMGWNKRESSSMTKGQKKQGKYVTYNKKTLFNDSGAQPHKHENKKYKSMADASNLPPGFILLNGEPVRVADLEGK